MMMRDGDADLMGFVRGGGVKTEGHGRDERISPRGPRQQFKSSVDISGRQREDNGMYTANVL
jgi:hypothetical protein